MKRPLLLILLVVCGARWISTAAETVTEADQLKLIAQRNIFDSTRLGRASRFGGAMPRRVKVDSFTLCGTSVPNVAGRHSIAIFDGYGAPRGKGLAVSDVINGYKVTRIDFDSVQLTASDGKILTLRMNTHIRREDGGPWAISYRAEAPPPPPPPAATADESDSNDSNASPAANDSGGDESDVIKRMKLRHQQDDQ